MHGSTGGSWRRSTPATATEVAQPFGKPAEHRPGAYQSATATAPVPDPTNLPAPPSRIGHRDRVTQLESTNFHYS